MGLPLKSKPTVLVIGGADEPHSVHLYQALQARQAQPFMLDSRCYPSLMRLEIHQSTDDPYYALFHWTKEQPTLDSRLVRSVFWRFYYGTPWLPEHLDKPEFRPLITRESQAALGALVKCLPCRWVNPPATYEAHHVKPYQLYLLQQQGIRTPKTLITNHPEALKEFYESLDGQVIVKPVSGGAHTRPVKPSDLKPARMEELERCPAQFQEKITGTDVRVYWIDGQIFALNIETPSLDFRDDPDALLRPIQLSAEEEALCTKVSETLGYVFTGIDFRRTPEGELVLFEANPSPMFMAVEAKTGYPLTETLCNLLLQPE